MKKRSILIVVFLLVITGVYLLIPQHLPKALFYNFADIDDYKIFENRIVKKGKHIPWERSVNYNKQALSEDAVQAHQEYESIAFLIIQNNEILFEKYWDGYNSESLSNSFSMAKSIVSLLIGIAIDEGLIKNIDQKVSDFLPEYKEGLNAQLTIKHLLTMSASLNWNESYSSPLSVTTRAYYGNDLKALMEHLQVVGTPGENYKYQSGITQLLAFVLEKATRKSLSEYASEKLWKPIGAKNSALWSLDKLNGVEKAYCCFNSNALDFARLGQLILNQGKYAGKQLVPAQYIADATTPANYLRNDKGEAVNYYGYQFWILDYKGMKIPYMRGINGQYVFVLKEKQAVIVRLGHKRSKVKMNHVPKDVFDWLDSAFEMLD